MAVLELTRRKIEETTKRIFEQGGVPAEDAAFVTETLLWAEECGVPSHGLMRVKPYVERIRRGYINPTPQISVRQCADGLFLVDADHSLGQLSAYRALQVCMEGASKIGVSAAVVNHGNHIGMAGYYARIAAMQGYIAFVCTNASATMAPFGGMEPRLGTNPFAFSCEDGHGGAFTLDVATSAVARGKIRLFEKSGKEIPCGWAIDKDGNDTVDPSAAMKGSLLPMGGHKGYGMAMAIDVLSAMLSGADLSAEAGSMFEMDHICNNGCYIQVLDPSRFLPREEMNSRMGQWMDNIQSAAVRPGFAGIRIPGDEGNEAAANPRTSLRISVDTWKELQELLKQ